MSYKRYFHKGPEPAISHLVSNVLTTHATAERIVKLLRWLWFHCKAIATTIASAEKRRPKVISFAHIPEQTELRDSRSKGRTREMEVGAVAY